MSGTGFSEKAANRQRVILDHLSQVPGLCSHRTDEHGLRFLEAHRWHFARGWLILLCSLQAPAGSMAEGGLQVTRASPLLTIPCHRAQAPLKGLGWLQVVPLFCSACQHRLEILRPMSVGLLQQTMWSSLAP